jgi:predicted regulator of amino acid metabolism with ACT domain
LWKSGTNSKTFNCELFQKSKVAVSELAGSVEENMRSLLDKIYKLINEKKLKHFIESIQPLSESLKPLEKGPGIKNEENIYSRC